MKYETKKINQTVKRNIQRFPEKFCFKLNEDEVENLRSQSVTSRLEKENYGGRRYLTYVFAEQRIAMLSGYDYTSITIRFLADISQATY